MEEIFANAKEGIEDNNLCDFIQDRSLNTGNTKNHRLHPPY